MDLWAQNGQAADMININSSWTPDVRYVLSTLSSAGFEVSFQLTDANQKNGPHAIWQEPKPPEKLSN